MIEKKNLKGLLPDELELFVTALGKEKYRTKQLLSWIYGRGVSDFEDMTDLSKKFRSDLGDIARVSSLTEVSRIESEEDACVKLLLAMEDGQRIETVAMDEGKRRTVCISTQVGCALGCRFCATAQLGLARNLTAAEMVDQVMFAAKLFSDHTHPVTNVVVMGMGEPLQNYDNLMTAIRLLRLEIGLGISSRKITVSTVGLVPQIYRLAEEGLNVKLAVSLNATTDEVRSSLMPINSRYPISELREAANHYARASGGRVTFEYTLIDGVNDSDDDARRLVKIAHGIPCKINLIPYNPSEGYSFRRSPSKRITAFRQILYDKHLTATIRWSRGADIAAACGQLQAAEPSTQLQEIAPHSSLSS